MKCLRLKISKPLNHSWDFLGDILRDLDYKCPKLFNFCMRTWFFWDEARKEIKEKTGEWPSKDAFLEPDLYNEMRKIFPDVPTRTVSAINQLARKRWQTDRKEVWSNVKSVSTFKRGGPIPFTNQQYKLFFDEQNRIVFQASLRPKTQKLEAFKLQLYGKKLDKSCRVLIARIISGEYKKGSAQIKYKDGQWNVIISYEPGKKNMEVFPGRVLGVDLGVASSFYAALSDSLERLTSGDAGEIQKFRFQIRKRRKEYQRQIGASTRTGRGRKKALAPLETLAEKEKHFRDTKYHTYTRMLIDFAVNHGVGVIQIENLDGLKARQDSFMLQNWAIGDFQLKLKNKAAEYGILVNEVNPRYTSQRCHVCGYIDSSNRKTQAEFSCISCKMECHADYNAAKNLSIPGIDEIITRALQEREKSKECSQGCFLNE